MLLATTLPGNGGFVAAALLIVLALLLVYLVLMATRLARLERETERLHARLDAEHQDDE